MGVTVEIEVAEILDGFCRAGRADLTRSYEPTETLGYLDVHEVWRVERLPVSEEARLDASAERGLQEELQQRRRVDDDHADSRSSRITVEAAVFNVTRRRL
jgi:hypothetical protein